MIWGSCRGGEGRHVRARLTCLAPASNQWGQQAGARWARDGQLCPSAGGATQVRPSCCCDDDAFSVGPDDFQACRMQGLLAFSTLATCCHGLPMPTNRQHMRGSIYAGEWQWHGRLFA